MGWSNISLKAVDDNGITKDSTTSRHTHTYSHSSRLISLLSCVVHAAASSLLQATPVIVMCKNNSFFNETGLYNTSHGNK